MTCWNTFLKTLDTEWTCDGNRITHLPGDDFSLRSLWDTIDSAEDSVWMMIFLLKPDRVGGHTLECLTAAAQRGCDVRLIYDAYASQGLRQKHLAPLHAAGGHSAPFHPYWPPWRKRGAFSIRNHCKYTIIDHQYGYCGGQNLSEKYAGHELGELLYDDDVARLEGPCTNFLEGAFIDSWEETTGETLPLPPQSGPCEDGCTAAILEHDPRDQPSILDDTLNRAFAGARQLCYVATPYFVPDQDMIDGLVEAATRGADVRIVTAGDSDRRLALAAGRHRYGPLLEAGARIYELNGRVLHSKTVTIDSELAVIGSFNMDLWTTEHTLDLAVLAANPDLAASLEKEFMHHLDDSREITREEHQSRTWLRQHNQRLSDRVINWIA